MTEPRRPSALRRLLANGAFANGAFAGTASAAGSPLAALRDPLLSRAQSMILLSIAAPEDRPMAYEHTRS